MYWDIERKRYPQYEHTAVIIAEDITSRFLNVINLFNGAIPLIAIQLKAFQIGASVTLVFTTVLDETPLGLVDEDEEIQEPADRPYWEKRGTKATLAMTDELLDIIHEWDPEVTLKYNKFYIGLAKNGQPNNFVVFRPQKGGLRLEVSLDRTDEAQKRLEEVGLDLMEYDSRWGRYRIRLAKDDIKKHTGFLKEFLHEAYSEAQDR